jgi:signal peptidase I
METAYHDGELIIVDKWSYADFAFFRVGDPNRGDVVILRPHVDNSREYFIKRVIGLPGDHLKIAGGAVSIRRPGDRVFTELDESYLSAENKGNTYLPLEEEKVFTIPEGQYFVMGDNRRNSTDSRVCFRSCETGKQSNFVKRSDIVGKVFFDFGSFNVIAKPFGWVYGPRFLDTMRSWKYPELEGARIRPQS